jgi:hypothetical protein
MSKSLRQPAHGAQAGAGRAAGGIAVAQRAVDVGDAGAFVDGDHLDLGRDRAGTQEQQAPALRMAHQVGAQLGDDEASRPA